MKKIMTFVFAAASVVGVVGARAADVPKPTDTGQLTVVQVIGLGSALRQLGNYHTQDGKLVEVPFKFDGMTLLTFAININAADRVEKNYQQAFAALQQQELGDRAKLLREKEGAATVQQLQEKVKSEAQKMADAPAGALLARIKKSELCMDSKPVAPCTTTNTIPPEILAVLVPIIDVEK